MMTPKQLFVLVIILTTALAIREPARAYEIFKWVDEEGVVHFSQLAPQDVDDVQTLRVHSTNSAEYDPLEDPYSIRNQAERTGEKWKELEGRKLARRERLREAAERAARYRPPAYEPGFYYYRTPGWHTPVRPVHPIHRPGRPFRTAGRQFVALDKLGLDSSNRPHSINSSAHHERINSSFRSLFSAPPGSRPRPPVHRPPGRPPAAYDLY